MPNWKLISNGPFYGAPVINKNLICMAESKGNNIGCTNFPNMGNWGQPFSGINFQTAVYFAMNDIYLVGFYNGQLIYNYLSKSNPVQYVNVNGLPQTTNGVSVVVNNGSNNSGNVCFFINTRYTGSNNRYYWADYFTLSNTLYANWGALPLGTYSIFNVSLNNNQNMCITTSNGDLYYVSNYHNVIPSAWKKLDTGLTFGFYSSITIDDDKTICGVADNNKIYAIQPL
jgi:hypothetical protein